MRRIALTDVPETEYRSPKGVFCQLSKEISMHLGARENEPHRHPFELEYAVVPPGKRHCPYHAHTAQTELYHIVSGSGKARHPGGLEELKAGDTIIFPPGEAHQIINDSEEPLAYWVIADNPPRDGAYYPDSDKWYLPPIGDFRFTQVDYHDGEE